MSDEKKKLGGGVNNLDNFCQNLDSKFYITTVTTKMREIHLYSTNTSILKQAENTKNCRQVVFSFDALTVGGLHTQVLA